MAENYAYAVARIRALESSLLSNGMIEQLLGCKDYRTALLFLTEKGWGDGAAEEEEILACETRKTSEVLSDLVKTPEVFQVLSYPKQFHNLKAAVKEAVSGKPAAKIYYDTEGMKGAEMARAITEKNFSILPDAMQAAAREAYEALLHTGDGQLCDIIIDRAALEAIEAAGRASKEEVIRQYAESTVAVADIKIAVRAQKTGRTADFMKRAMAPCSSVSVEKLTQAALNSTEAIASYLEETGYREGAGALREGASAFERWCDNRIIEIIKPQKYQAFSVGPIVAYVLARENEIKTVRLILSGKKNGLSEAAIWEKVREMYV